MVRRWLNDPHEVNAGDGDRTLSLEVFMLDSELVGWKELESLDGEALLISKRGSMSVVSSCPVVAVVSGLALSSSGTVSRLCYHPLPAKVRITSSIGHP
uniref:KIB1-4 beta-propeller domain-containing protein n=1 Tax=Arundo donax TaxID=35708 RepID=A0A0A9EKV3_ARUDO